MKYSKQFARTLKNSKEFESKNATLLIRAGYIDQVMAGVYTYLPLGYRVLRKIENIVREEMDKVSQEIFFPAISPKEFWEQTERYETIDVLFKVVGANELSRKRNDAEYVLNPTQEDLVAPLGKKFNLSYKDFPYSVYQIQSKFRNEPRPKSGILRGREFIMKDAYSFHVSEADLLKYYEQMKGVYTQMFEKLGIGDHTVMALASGGDFTDEFSHEFQTFTDAGEDVLFYEEVDGVYYNREVTASKAPAVTYQDSAQLEMKDEFGEGIIGVQELADFLKIPVEKTTKTLLFVGDETRFIAVAVRGGYEVDEVKLKKVTGVKSLRMATESEVKEATGTVPGYVGILNLADDVEVFIDESCDNRLNFECGANKENYHSTNVNWGRDIQKPDQFYDIKVAQEGDLNPKTGEVYRYHKAAEVGNIFPLNTKFSDAVNYTFTDENGEQQQVYMGSYGLGTTRVMGVIAEVLSDEKGLNWPMAIAPYHVHLIGLGKEGDDSLRQADELYSKLQTAGIEVLYDDRFESAGTKFADSDLLGIPIRVVISKRSLENDEVEVKLRSSSDVEMVEVSHIIEKLEEMIS